MQATVTENIAITALGVVTPCGGNAQETSMAIQAGIMRFTEHETYISKQNDPELDSELPVIVSSVPLIDQHSVGAERFYQLATPALEQVISYAKLNKEQLNRCGFFLSLPAVDAVTATIGLDNTFLVELCKRANFLPTTIKKINQSGSTGMFEHIEEAIKLIQTGQLDYCVVGGVDTWLLNGRLEQLDASWRIKSERNRDGFIPGEAATMILLERETTAKSRSVPVLSVITGFGNDEEPENFFSEKNSTGQGLTHALETVLSSHDKNKVFNTAYCDINGESYYAVECGLILTRLGKSLQNVDLIYPAANCGDVGAATGGLLLACATTRFNQAPTKENDVLLWTASDNGKRSALSLQQYDTNSFN